MDLDAEAGSPRCRRHDARRIRMPAVPCPRVGLWRTGGILMPAFAMPRANSAFANGPKQKKAPRQKIEEHLKFIRTLPCLITGARPVEAAHIRYADMRYGKRDTGMQEKPSDHWVVPLSPALHREQHDF